MRAATAATAAHTGVGGGDDGGGEREAAWGVAREARAARAARRADKGDGDGGDGGGDGGGGGGNGGGGIDGGGGRLGGGVGVAPPSSCANACTRGEGARMSSCSRNPWTHEFVDGATGATFEIVFGRAANEHEGPTSGHATRAACWASAGRREVRKGGAARARRG